MNHQLDRLYLALRSRIKRLEQRDHLETAEIQLARALAGEEAEVLACDDCQTLLPEHIESELNSAPGPGYHAVRCHLDICPACGTSYIDLLEMALQVEAGFLPTPFRQVDLSFMDWLAGRSSSDA